MLSLKLAQQLEYSTLPLIRTNSILLFKTHYNSHAMPHDNCRRTGHCIYAPLSFIQNKQFFPELVHRFQKMNRRVTDDTVGRIFGFVISKIRYMRLNYQSELTEWTNSNDSPLMSIEKNIYVSRRTTLDTCVLHMSTALTPIQGHSSNGKNKNTPLRDSIGRYSSQFGKRRKEHELSLLLLYVFA